MPSRPSSEAGSSRSRLLQSAKRLFALQGYERTATSAIAREAGTSESQLMRYFGGKVGLLEALFDEAWKDLNERVRTTAAAAPSQRVAIIDVLQTIATALGRDSDLATLFLFEGRRLRGDEPRMRLSQGLQAFTDTVRGLVKEAVAARELDSKLDVSALTSSILGACEGMIRDRLIARASRRRGFAEREIRRTLEAMLDGFARNKTRARR